MNRQFIVGSGVAVRDVNVRYAPLVSFVICTYSSDRANELRRLVRSIIRENTKDIELILVAEESIELVEGIVSLVTGSDLSSRIIFSKKPLGISGARNLGMAYATGRYISFVDDDALILPGWKRNLLKDFGEEDVVGVVGKVSPDWEKREDEWFPRQFYWMIGCSDWRGLSERTKVMFGWGVNMTFKREAIHGMRFRGGFAKGEGTKGKLGPVGDDTDFCMRVVRANGRMMLYDPDVAVLHRVYSYRLNPLLTRRYAFWQGFSEAMFSTNRNRAKSRLAPMKYIAASLIEDFMPETVRIAFFNLRIAGKRINLLVTSLAFFFLGLLSYRSNFVFRLSNRVLRIGD